MKNILLAIILVFAAFLFSYQTGNTLLFDVDEPRYAEAAREMLVEKEYVSPQFNYKPRYDKPILFYWLEIASFKTLGVSEFAARLPSIFAGLGMVSLAFLLGNIQGFGIISAIIMMSCLQITIFSKFAITDMTLCFFISAAIAFFYIGYHKRSINKKQFAFHKRTGSRWLIASLAMAGFGALCKGPIAVALPSIVVFPFLWWMKDIKQFFIDAKNDIIIGFLLFFAITVPWYVAVHIATEGAFTKSFFLDHNFGRYISVISSHKGAWWYYIPIIAVGLFPWSIFFLQAFFNPGIYTDPYKPNDSRTIKLLPLFCFWWATIVFLFFSFSSTKLVTYILPAFLPAIIIMAKWWDNKFKIDKYQDLKNMDALIGLVIMFILSIIFLYLGLTKIDLIFKGVEAPNVFLPVVIIAVMLAACSCIAMTAIMKQPRIAFAFVVIPVYISFLIATQYFYLPFNSYMQKGIKDFVEGLPPNAKIISLGKFKPSMVFYSKRKVKDIRKQHLAEFIDVMSSDRQKYFISREKYLARIDERLKNRPDIDHPIYYIWNKDHRYIYGSNKPKLGPVLKVEGEIKN